MLNEKDCCPRELGHNCIECEATLTVPADAIDGEIISCPDCGSALELVLGSDGTVQLKPAEVIGEDWGE